MSQPFETEMFLHARWKGTVRNLWRRDIFGITHLHFPNLAHADTTHDKYDDDWVVARLRGSLEVEAEVPKAALQ